MVVAVRRRQPRLDQLARQRGHVRLFPLHHHARARPDRPRRETPRARAPAPGSPATCGAGKARRWRRPISPGCRGTSSPSPPSARRAIRGWPRRRGSAAPGPAAPACGRGSGRHPRAARSLRARHRVAAPASRVLRAFSTRSTSFTASSRSSWCSSRRCRSASNGAGSASRLVKTSRVSPDLQQPLAQREDRFQLAARFFGKRLRRLFLHEGRQEDALHVVHHQQRRLLAQRALDLQDRLFQIVERGDGVTPAPAAGRGHRAPRRRLLCVSTETNAARCICCERTIQRANSAASAVLPSPPWPRTTA